MLPLAWPQQQKVKEQHHVSRSTFYGMQEDLTIQTRNSKSTKVFLSGLAHAKTLPKVWCTSHGRRAGHDGLRHALFAVPRFGWALHFGLRARARRFLKRATFAQTHLLNLTH